MRGRLLLLTGGGGAQTLSLPLIDAGSILAPDAFVDQVVALPLIDAGSISGPDAFVSGIVDLPLINDSQVLAPAVFVDQILSLALIDDAQVFGPTLTAPNEIPLPLIDDAGPLAPSVFVDLQIPLPLIDGGAVYGPSVVPDQALALPLIDGGWPFAPAVTRSDQVGLEVTAWSRAGALLATLSQSHSRQWQDRIVGAGSFAIAVQNTDANYAHTDFDRIVRFSLDGQVRFAGLVEARDVVSLARGEDHDQTTTLAGRGVLALLAEGVVYPSRGVGSVPIEDIRSFSWPSVDFDDSGWGYAITQKQQSNATALAYGSAPEGWPDGDAWWIWGVPFVADQPLGSCYFRKTITLGTASTVRFFVAADDEFALYVDGVRLGEESRHYLWTKARIVDIDLDAGTHTIALRGANIEFLSGLPNAAAVILTAYTLDTSGLLDTHIVRTDSTWRCVAYPASAPGMTPGRVLRLLLEDCQARGELLDVTLDCTDTLDSNGNPWGEFAEVSSQVGRTVLDLALEMAESLIDVEMAPGDHVLRAYRFGERGATRSVTLAQGATPAASDFLELEHQGRRSRTNALLIRYAGGTTEVVDQPSIDAHGRRGDSLTLGAVQNEAEAQRIGSEVMARRSEAIYQTAAALKQASSGVPYADFGPGDWITAPDETGAPASARVRCITTAEDVDGVITWHADLNDVLEEIEARYDVWLRRMAGGSLHGTTGTPSPVSTGGSGVRDVAFVKVAEFSYEGTVTTSSVVRLLLNGAYIGSSVTFTSGDEQRSTLGIQKVLANTDYLQLEVDGVLSQKRTAEASGNLIEFEVTRTAAADGTAGVDAQARAI